MRKNISFYPPAMVSISVVGEACVPLPAGGSREWMNGQNGWPRWREAIALLLVPVSRLDARLHARKIPCMHRFSGKESERLLRLDGLELASFWRRALAFLIDWISFCVVLMAILALVLKIREWLGHGIDVHGHIDLRPGRIVFSTTDKDLAFFGEEWFEVLTNVALPILFFGLITWAGRGRSLGKWITKIRIVSTVHPHLGIWHAVERSLGYAAAALEGGFGFLQFFIHPNRRCARSRTHRKFRLERHSWR